jgi:CheY-like chemotaxis protein/anti-sigma regulatory factor (Ser/Thr protein kinase)
LIKTLAEKREIKISHKGLTGAVVRADRTRLRQVMLNLLSNAIKYNRQGGKVRLEVQAEGDERLRIKVIDTGLGISDARLQEVFQPFNRLGAENSGIEGTGIGLTITRRIVELMGGTVDVESEMGVGSTFWIELPLESTQSLNQRHTVDDETKSEGHLAVQSVNEHRHKVLYIEDNPSNLRLVAQILGRRKNIDLITAHTPELGIELAMSQHPHLILLDINMPGMDGYQVLGVLKAEASLKSIPVIAVTANAMLRDIERGKAAGFADYLTKPIDVIKFLSVINSMLGSDEETINEH